MTGQATNLHRDPAEVGVSQLQLRRPPILIQLSYLFEPGQQRREQVNRAPGSFHGSAAPTDVVAHNRGKHGAQRRDFALE